MTMSFKREGNGQYISRDGLFLILRNENKWDSYILEDKTFTFYAGYFKSCKAAREYILNSFYCQHVNL